MVFSDPAIVYDTPQLHFGTLGTLVNVTIRAKSFPTSTIVWPDGTRDNTIQLDDDAIISTQTFVVHENPMSYSVLIESVESRVGTTVFSFTVQEYCMDAASFLKR